MKKWERPPPADYVLHLRLPRDLIKRIDQKAVVEGMTRTELIRFVLQDIPYWVAPEWRLTKDQMFRRHSPEAVQARQEPESPDGPVL